MDRLIKSIDIHTEFESFESLEKASFGENANSDFAMHKWLLDDNPYNPSTNMMYVLKEGDKVIAADGLWPVPLYYYGKTILAAHSIKSMTHPDYKRQGIFTQMTQNSINMATTNGIDLVFGLANHQSYQAYLKFGWPTYFEKDAFVRPLQIKKLLTKKLKSKCLASLGNQVFSIFDSFKTSKLAKGYALSSYTSIPRDVDAIWEAYKAKYKVLIERSYTYLDYRYNKRPDTSYQTIILSYQNKAVGFSVFRMADTGSSKVISLCECFTDPENRHHIGNLYKATLLAIKPLGADYMVASFGGYGQFRTEALRHGFKALPTPPKNNMMIGFTANKDISDEWLSGYEKWHISQGDGETELDL